MTGHPGHTAAPPPPHTPKRAVIPLEVATLGRSRPETGKTGGQTVILVISLTSGAVLRQPDFSIKLTVFSLGCCVTPHSVPKWSWGLGHGYRQIPGYKTTGDELIDSTVNLSSKEFDVILNKNCYWEKERERNERNLQMDVRNIQILCPCVYPSM